MITGACLCGALRYEVEGLVSGLHHCHCATCRKHHGAPFATHVVAAVEGFRWVAGDGAVGEYRVEGARGRRFCQVCGAVAPVVVGERVVLAAGNLVGELGVEGGVHMFVGETPGWHAIGDELPRFEGAAPGWVGGEEVPGVEGRGAGSEGAEGPSESGTLGSCLCGEVRFEVKGRPARWMQCHCSRCRRGRSAAHGSNMFYPVGQFAWRAGEGLVRSFRPADAARFVVSFCGRCGGGAPTGLEKAPMALVPAGLLDGEPGGRPDAHIHVASRAPWYVTDDGLPQFAELPPS